VTGTTTFTASNVGPEEMTVLEITFTDHPRILRQMKLRAICLQLRRDRVSDYWKRPNFWDAIFVSTVEQMGRRLLPLVHSTLALQELRA
jgi:hypothetical protein